MNLILILKELWRRRVLVALAIFVAAAVATLAVFQVTPSPPFIAKRDRVNAQGSIEILVDSARSPIADARRDLAGLTARAGVFARLMVGGNVIGHMAEANKIPVEQIGTVGPVPLPGEAPGAEQESAELRPYGVAVTQPEALPILKVVTRAPTVPEARSLAAAAPAAIRQVVKSIQAQQGTPLGKRVQFRVLGPAEAGRVEDALGKKIALLLFIVLLAIFIVLILGLPRLVTAWREAETEVGPWGKEDEPHHPPEIVHLPADRGGNPEGDGREATRIGQRET